MRFAEGRPVVMGEAGAGGQSMAGGWLDGRSKTKGVRSEERGERETATVTERWREGGRGRERERRRLVVVWSTSQESREKEARKVRMHEDAWV